LKILLLLLAGCLVSFGADARIHRDAKAVAEFKREHPCPATGATRGPCKGWIVDHHQALCVGGRDEPANMRWQTVEAARAKDKWECRPGWEAKLQEIDHG